MKEPKAGQEQLCGGIPDTPAIPCAVGGEATALPLPAGARGCQMQALLIAAG